MNVPSNLLYAKTHEWVKKESDVCKCGVTDYAQHELSDVVFVELPESGKTVEKGGLLCVVESVKAASDIYAPISGEIIAVNESLASSPEMINTDPYGDAWICTIKPSNDSELDELLSPEQYTEILRS